MDVTIEFVEAIPVRVPRSKPMISAGTDRPLIASDFGIVRVRDSDGCEGVGEISMNGASSGALQCARVSRSLAPALVGRRAFDVRGAIAAMDEALRGFEPAKAGVEMALLDLVGKQRGVPLYELLGGRVRDCVTVRWGLGHGPPEAGVEELQVWLGTGIRTAKIKIGRPGADLDRDMVRSVRESVGPDIAIVVDANAGYASPAEAIHELARLAEYDLQLIEQPVARAPLDQLALVRSRVSAPILADESMRHFTDAYAIARAEAADVLSIYICEAGGLFAAMKAFAIAEAAGLPCTIGSQCELGIGTAAMAHLGVCMVNLAYDSDVTGHLRYPVDLIDDALDYRDGAVYPPARPGLGVTLNEEAVTRFRLDI
jgi:L-alanine-DL-glutamate epimerase-like enolase superfamily enzyme